jgi:RNA-directed DNA polymerase
LGGAKVNETKPFCISKKKVMAAWEKVKANKGTYGIDRESIEDFELNLKDNLYKLWNRMASGTYFPPPVRAVEIPKPGGKKRLLGIPTVTDRVAQAVVKDYLEPIADPKFHEDSYGYRPGKSALEAVGVARQRCWRQNWVIDLDIKGFFDNLDHELVMKAVKHHTSEKWVHLYIKRWLEAPMQLENGEIVERKLGTPQGGVISPLLANLFMHHAFDDWMKRHHPEVKFERFADDVVTHCNSLKQAEEVLEKIRSRLKECGLELHREKTKIVYCKDDTRKGIHENESFDFLGYTFRPRLSKKKVGGLFVNFSPAISDKAAKKIRKEIRRWRIHLRSDKTLTELAKMFNSKVQGWVNYYGKFYKSAMYSSVGNMERYLIRWAMRKYKKLRRHKRRARYWLGSVRKREPNMFVHWKMGLGSLVG